MSITFDKSLRYKGVKNSKGVWRRSDGSIIPLGNRIKNSDGSYSLLNSNGTMTRLTTKDGKFIGLAKKRLSYADKVNIAAGNVRDAKTKKWRYDTEKLTDDYHKLHSEVFRGVDGYEHFFDNGDLVNFGSNGKITRIHPILDENNEVIAAKLDNRNIYEMHLDNTGKYQIGNLISTNSKSETIKNKAKVFTALSRAIASASNPSEIPSNFFTNYLASNYNSLPLTSLGLILVLNTLNNTLYRL